MALTDKTQVKNVVELVLPEDFVPSIKTLRECLVLLILSLKDYSVLKDRGFLICLRQTRSSRPHGLTD